MDLVIGRPVVDGVDAAGELGREVVAVEELGEGRGGIEVGDDNGGGDHVAVREGHALDATIGHDDVGHLHVAPQLTAVLVEQGQDVLGDRADPALDLRHRRPIR